jgi:hypothetical protein
LVLLVHCEGSLGGILRSVRFYQQNAIETTHGGSVWLCNEAQLQTSVMN